MPVSPVSPLALTAHRKRLYFVNPFSGFEPGLPKSALRQFPTLTFGSCACLLDPQLLQFIPFDGPFQSVADGIHQKIHRWSNRC
jgi:hypothetical protein